MKYLCIAVLFISATATAQWKSYRLTSNGDTINCIDNEDLKQGKWSIEVASLRGNPGYDEEGVFVNSKKEGLWRVYSTMGDLIATERYRSGNKDGKSQYYNIAGIVREESWKAIIPKSEFDTVEVYDLEDENKMIKVPVKADGMSVRDGMWKYFESGSGSIIRTESYVFNKLQPLELLAPSDAPSQDSTKTAKAGSKLKPKEVQAFEKKTGRKKVKVIDGSTY